MKRSSADITLFSTRLSNVCQEMGATLIAAAFSPNIRDRHDLSCAVFDRRGRLAAQAAHIPVHLGSMSYAMADLVKRFDWAPGDMVILNDPYLGGTHLPDVTLVAPVFDGDAVTAFVANRAHHADIGAEEPGSMPISSRLEEEGLVISPQYLFRGDVEEAAAHDLLTRSFPPDAPTFGDITAQVSANRRGRDLVERLIARHGGPEFEALVDAQNAYARRLAASTFARYAGRSGDFVDVLDDDGLGTENIEVHIDCRVEESGVTVDFSGTSPQVRGNLNCPLSVTAAAVYYVMFCLMPRETPACHGAFDAIEICAPEESLVNASKPAAVAAGNVETSTRIVDTLLGALAAVAGERTPAASQGTMNNLAMGADSWSYYETIGGGTGAHAAGRGLDGTHSHMTNTRNTSIEVLESHFPLRIERYGYRRGSGGGGRTRGGDGLVREYLFLEPARISLITERRRHAPWGLAGGGPGATGANRLNGRTIPAKCSLSVKKDDRLSIETPGGGGYGVEDGAPQV